MQVAFGLWRQTAPFIQGKGFLMRVRALSVQGREATRVSGDRGRGQISLWLPLGACRQGLGHQEKSSPEVKSSSRSRLTRGKEPD